MSASPIRDSAGKLAITKSACEVKPLLDPSGNRYATLYHAHIDVYPVCMVWCPPGNTEQEANAALIAETFNVTNATGRTPAELRDLVRELRDAIEMYIEYSELKCLTKALEKTEGV